MKEIEVEGKTVTLAVEKGLSELGLRRDQVEVQVLQEASPGFLGIGTKLAKVRIREKIWGEQEQKSDSGAPGHPRPPARSSGILKPAPKMPSQKPVGDLRTAPSPSGYRGSRERAAAAADRSRTSAPSIAHPPPADTALACAEAKTVIEEMLKMMEFQDARVSTSWDSDQARVRAELDTPDASLLIGNDGRSLESLQFLTTLILSRRMKTPVAVQVETSGYWKEKEESVIRQVHQAMEMVKRTSRPVRLKPMDACLRRLVHRTLAKHPEFETASEGEGPWRKVVLKPKKK